MGSTDCSSTACAERNALRAVTRKIAQVAKLAEALDADAVTFVAEADRSTRQKRTAQEGKRQWKAACLALLTAWAADTEE